MFTSHTYKIYVMVSRVVECLSFWGCHTKHHKPGGLKQQKSTPPVCKPEVQNQGVAGLHSFQGTVFLPLSAVAPVVLGVLGLWLHRSSVCLVITWPPLCVSPSVSMSLCLFLIRTLVLGLGAHPEKPGP